jgi:hypothetical protein
MAIRLRIENEFLLLVFWNRKHYPLQNYLNKTSLYYVLKNFLDKFYERFHQILRQKDFVIIAKNGHNSFYQALKHGKSLDYVADGFQMGIFDQFETGQSIYKNEPSWVD